jgi:hypothetical protein
MMTGSYILQIDKHKLNNNSIDLTCPLCKADDETMLEQKIPSMFLYFAQ